MGRRRSGLARRLGAVPRLLLGQVERADRTTAVACGVVEKVGRDQPDDLELDAVGVLAVEALGGSMVARSDEGVRFGQPVGGALELVEGVDLPRQVVEANSRPACS